MTPEQRQYFREMLELTRGFMPHNPVEAHDRVEGLISELDEISRPIAEDQELRALALTMLESYRRAADAWQAENARRGAAMQAREHAVIHRDAVH